MIRFNKFVKSLKVAGLDSFLVSEPVNITYLSGFKQPCGYLLITPDKKPIYFTNPLYKKAANVIKEWELVISSNTQNIFNLAAEKINKLKLTRIGFESRNLPFAEHHAITKGLHGDVEFVETTNFVENLRIIKDKNEISSIRKAIHTSSQAFDYIEEISTSTMSEKGLSIEIEKFLRLKGNDKVAFDCIVASGKNTVFPHHLPTNDKIGKRFFLIDLGSRHYGYCADLTRVFFWGKMPQLLQKIYSTVLKAQELAIKKVKDGITAAEVDKAAREFIDKRGFGKYFVHGTGHGIGLSVHEPPFIGPNNKEILKEGMVITVEPAIYFANKFGIRIEDMVLVKRQKGELLSGNTNRRPKAS